MWLSVALLSVSLLTGLTAAGEILEKPLANPSFEEGVGTNGIPKGWSCYAGKGEDLQLQVVEGGMDGGKALLIHDGDPEAEIGVYQDIPVQPTSNMAYQATVMVQAIAVGSGAGAHIQMRFLPSGELVQADFGKAPTGKFMAVSVIKVAPPDTRSVRIYLYSHAGPTPKVMVDNVKLVAGVEPPPPPPPPFPEPISPQYDKLKDLHLTTDLVKRGQATVAIVAPASGIYDQPAQAIQKCIRELSGVSVPIVSDASPQAAVPIQGNLIILGNRSTNKTINALYDLYYTLLDLKYPGVGGSVVRTLHDPFGDGHNVIFAGGSGTRGVAAAAEVLVRKLQAAQSARGELSVGRLMEIRLGEGITPPTDVQEMETWEASKGYRSVGYFGWNSISKHMAMYYMTGDEHHAREFIRLAFPDAQARKEIEEIDGERLENKAEPLAGPYHYNAHMMILFWDLIEESPAFTDEERLRVTNAFAKQLEHPQQGSGYNASAYRLNGVPSGVGSRHGQWTAISLYCLGRYFQKYYPDPIWDQCVRAGKLHFASLHQHAWVSGESDNLFWYSTGIAPIFTYLVLTGDRIPLENGVLEILLRGQEILASAVPDDTALNSASLGFLHKAAYVTGDGRWLHYRQRIGLDTDGFRLGQSFWPADNLQPQLPLDMTGTWSINPVPEPLWKRRGSGIALERSFLFGSYHNTVDASGDFILLDGFNGASRNPYHTFGVLELRINGYTLLRGYHNQVLPSADGMVEPRVAMDAALLHCDVTGATVAAVGEVPAAAYCNWRRYLTQRVGKYALITDDLTFRTDSENMELVTEWQPLGGAWDAERNAVRIAGGGGITVPEGWIGIRALAAECTSQPAGADKLIALESHGIKLLRAEAIGSWLEMPFALAEPTAGEFYVDLVDYVDRGKVRVYLDGKCSGDDIEHNAPSATQKRAAIGRHELAAGRHALRLEVVEKPAGEKCYIGLAGLSIKPDKMPTPSRKPLFELHPCDVTEAGGRGVINMTWRGAVNQGEHRIFFHLLGQTTDGADQPLECVRIADNAAALALPSPAIAVIGKHEVIEGELVILASDHLYGYRLRAAGAKPSPISSLRQPPLVRSDAPVDLDWDFASGALEIVAAEHSRVQLSLEARDQVMVDGEAGKGTRGDGGYTAFELPPGRHTFTGAMPNRLDLHWTNISIAETLAAAMRQRTTDMAAAKVQPQKLSAPELTAAMTAEIGGKPVAMTVIPSSKRPLVCVAEGQTVHVLTAAGEEIRAMQTDGPIRVLRWWARQKLLLVGCRDEQVIAFDLDGNRRWSFTSVMDPAVYRAAKSYWFKTASGHEGIHCLHTGVFLDGEEQCFVGSACTLEILDEHGKLLERLPVFWGPGWKMKLIDGPDDSINLLIARWPNGNDTLAVVNNKSLSVGRGFYGVPAGHTMVGGWTGLNRVGLFYEDINADGTKEFISAENGVWNRVTVWSGDGKALYNAQFGPGVSNRPGANLVAMDVADLDGDGSQEIIVGTAKGLVVALSNQCVKIWSERTPSPPAVLKSVPAPDGVGSQIVVGCEDGTVALLDGNGNVVRLGAVTGRPTHIERADMQAGVGVILATAKGCIHGFSVGG